MYIARENLQSLPNEALVETGLENLLYPEKIDLLPHPRPCGRSQSQEVVAEAKSCSYTHPPVQPRRSPRLHVRS
jgi:hypothetical protein